MGSKLFKALAFCYLVTLLACSAVFALEEPGPYEASGLSLAHNRKMLESYSRSELKAKLKRIRWKIARINLRISEYLSVAVQDEQTTQRINRLEQRVAVLERRQIAVKDALYLASGKGKGTGGCGGKSKNCTTPTPSPTQNETPSPSPSPSQSPVPSPSNSPTPAPTQSQTPSPSPSPSATPVIPAPSIDLVVSTSQQTGPAPLAVAFDATATIGLNNEDYVGATFIWDFGDQHSAPWLTNGKDSNRATGFITGHVYSVPGNYTARVSVIDSSGQRSAELQIPITVTTPESVYTQTFCLSSSGTDTSCAPGAIALSSFSQVLAHAGPGKRFLIQRNFTETLTGPVGISNISGPMEIAAYGSGSMPTLYALSTNVEAAFYVQNSDNIRLRNLRFIGPDEPHGSSAPIGFWVAGTNRLLLESLDLSGFDRNIHFAGHFGVAEVNSNFVVSSLLHNSGYFTLTTSVNFRNTNILGNMFADATQGHIRVLESQKTNIAHNHFLDSFSIKSHSGNTVMVDNIFEGGTYARIAFGTGGSEVPCDAENKLNHLVEHNSFLGVTPTYMGGVVGVSVECGGGFVLRGNYFDHVSNAIGVDGARFTSGFGGNTPVRIYNNYARNTQGPNSAAGFISVTETRPAVDIRNNLVYFPEVSFHDGDYTTAITIRGNGLSGLNINSNLWYLPNSNGNNGSTPGIFAISGSYPAYTGYSYSLQNSAAVQYFGMLQPLSTWWQAGFDTSTLFSNPQQLEISSSGKFSLSPSSPAVAAGDITVPYVVDFYGEEFDPASEMPIGPFRSN